MICRLPPRSAVLVLLSASVACGSPQSAPVAPAPPPPVPSASAAAVEIDAGAVRPPWAAEYPATRTADVVEDHFGVAVHDPYRWLEDGSSPEVQAWVNAQAALARKHLDALPDRAAIAGRLHELVYTEARYVPAVRGKRLFFLARSAQQEKEVLYWRGADGKDHVLLDPNTWPKKDNPSLQDFYPSWDGTRVAYSVALHNSDEGTLHIVDVATGRESARDAIPHLDAPDLSWTPDSTAFYYRYLPAKTPEVKASEWLGLTEIRRHVLGTDPARDEVMHEKTGDPSLWLDSLLSRDGRWLFATIEHLDTADEVSFRDLRAKTGEWTKLTGTDHGLVSVQAYRDKFYLATNDGAPNWRVVVVDPAHPEHEHWKEIIPERKDARLEGFLIRGGRLVLKYYKDVVTHLEVRALDGAFVREIPLPEAGTAELPGGEQDGDDGYVAFSSFTHPPEIEHISIRRGTSDLWYRERVPVDTAPYVAERVFYPSKDGTRVPMFVVRAKNAPRDGTAPLLLRGYGGFDITYGPEFFRAIFPWLERGGIYAWADLRGGGEYGEAWHEAGKRHKKQNVFDDFIAAAEYLIKEGYTRSDRLAAVGASNGGLLMGAVTTQRPDLFRAILCGAPVLDMVRFPLVGVGGLWTEEYGDPSVEADFRALIAYSPIHNVKDGTRYPSFLMLSPANDDRVDPMQARKFVAELQAASTGGPALFRVQHDSGHLGADTREFRVGYWADQLAFALAEIHHPGSVMSTR